MLEYSPYEARGVPCPWRGGGVNELATKFPRFVPHCIQSVGFTLQTLWTLQYLCADLNPILLCSRLTLNNQFNKPVCAVS